MRIFDPGWLILVSVRWGLIACFLRFLFRGQFRLELRPRVELFAFVGREWRCINWTRFCVVNRQNSKILKCVLAPVRNFFVVCFEWVARNSVCGAEPVRSGRPLVHFEVTTGSILGGFWRRAIVTSLPRTAGTYPPKSPPFAKALRMNPFGIHQGAGVALLRPRLSGHKNIIRIFWVKLFVARFWSDFKEWSTVCANYFCGAVPFWE
jgi:hypothetical protein